MVIDGHDYPLISSDYNVQGKGRGGDTAKKVGGGAVLGANHRRYPQAAVKARRSVRRRAAVPAQLCKLSRMDTGEGAERNAVGVPLADNRSA